MMDEATSQVCTFRIGELTLGVPVDSVLEVMRERPVTPVPRSAEAIAGITNLRGRIAMVVDARTRFGLDPGESRESAANIVLTHQDDLYVFAVDAIGDLIAIPDDALHRIPETLDRPRPELLESLYEMDDEWMLIVDVERLLAFEQ